MEDNFDTMLKRIFKFFIAILLLAAICAGAFRIWWPKEFSEASWWARSNWHAALYTRDLEILGLNRMSREDLEVLLPYERSNIWWRLNADLLVAGLRRYPLVREVDIRPCQFWSFRCYQLQIKEREAEMVAEIGGERWVVGEDGAFISPAPAAAALPGAVVVRGLGELTLSPDTVRSRLRLVGDLARQLESALSKKISLISFFSFDEVDLRASGIPFSIRLDLSEAGKNVPIQVERLSKLLEEFKDREYLIESIDLALQKSAVVKLAPTPSAGVLAADKQKK